MLLLVLLITFDSELCMIISDVKVAGVDPFVTCV